MGGFPTRRTTKYYCVVVIRKTQIKNTTRSHFTPSRMAIIKMTISAGQDVEKLEPSHCWQEGETVWPLWKPAQQIRRKAKYQITTWPSNFSLKCEIPKIIKKYMPIQKPTPSVQRNTTHESPKVEATQMPIDRCRGKQNVCCRILFSHKKGVKFWYLLRLGGSWKISRWVRGARHDGP